ncbi:MAG TPA: AAA family ATPase [Kofleriaceae bacterium]|nr:AAA family ATPase [Kofleriaceae bacterium]
MSEETKLKFHAQVVRRVMPSEYSELAPIAASHVASYGEEAHTRSELALALSELVEEARPASVARLQLPDGVALELVEVTVARAGMPEKLAKPVTATIAVIVVPEPRPDGGVAGHWAFVPAVEHACYIERGDELAERIAGELAMLPAALELGIDGWKRMLTWAAPSLEMLEVELATSPVARLKGRKALAEAERKRQAIATLDAAGRRLRAADPAPPLVGRELQLADLSRALERTGKRRASVLIVGDEASGKSALALAWLAAHPDRDVWATSASELVAGASGLGEWQERVTGVLAAAETLDAVLYFDDFGALFADRPAEGGIELGAALRRHVADGRVRVIGELTAVALDRAERTDASLVGAMSRITLAPTDPDTTTRAALAWAEYWRAHEPSRPQIAPVAVQTAVDFARRYLPYRAFPGKAIRLLEELRVAHETDRDAEGRGKLLGDSELFAAFAWTSGIPRALLDDSQPLATADVIAQLRRRMIGQDTAVARVAGAISIAKARLQPADKPLASLLFVGPSGVGKTELARSVAAYLFGNPDKLVRLDMSEYSDPWAAERLFGGTGDDGRLTSAVRSQPFGVVLLDEIEKAHRSVFDVLLQVLGEARLTDGRGRTTFFHNAIIVLTSNLGTRGAKGTLGLSPERDHDVEDRRYRAAVHAAFRPELVNRLDQIVVFHPLEPAEIARVAEIAIARLAERRGLTQAGIILDVSPAAIARLADAGFSPELGARALRRYLDAELVAPAARLLARAGVESHGGTLTVRAPDEPSPRNPGSRIAEEQRETTIALWRRAAATGRRMVKSALALAELRRETDRELSKPAATNVLDKLREIEGTLATASRITTDGQTKLPGAELARLSAQHARLSALWGAAAAGQAELRASEELCLEALARDVDAVDLIDAAVAARDKFRRDLFWLMTALRPQRPGITLLVHSPDSGQAVAAWVRLVLDCAAEHNWRGHVHRFGEQAPNWSHAWGPPHDRAWAKGSGVVVPAALVRVAGNGAETLLALEAGLHKFSGLGGEPCHAWVEPLEPKVEFTDFEWSALPTPPSPKSARGQAMREVTVGADRVAVYGDEIVPPWKQLAGRLAEAACARLLVGIEHEGHKCRFDRDLLWSYANPLAAIAKGALP